MKVMMMTKGRKMTRMRMVKVATLCLDCNIHLLPVVLLLKVHYVKKCCLFPNIPYFQFIVLILGEDDDEDDLDDEEGSSGDEDDEVVEGEGMFISYAYFLFALPWLQYVSIETVFCCCCCCSGCDWGAAYLKKQNCVYPSPL